MKHCYIAMLSLEKCSQILNRKNKNYSNDEVKIIRDFLYDLAEILFTNREVKPEKIKSIKKK